MIVTSHITIKTLLAATHLQLGKHTGPREDLEISVNRGQTDPGHFFPDNPVQLISGQMLSAFLQFLQNYLTLAGHTYWHIYPLMRTIISL
jgi:hypothetical protein